MQSLNFSCLRTQLLLTQKPQQLKRVILNAWPETKQEVPNNAKLYWNFRDGINEIEGILFEGEKIIVPTSLRKEMLASIHEVHLGIQKCMKRGRQIGSGQVCQTILGTLCPTARHVLKHHPSHRKEPFIPYEAKIYFSLEEKITS